jgi:hypothetical protein
MSIEAHLPFSYSQNVTAYPRVVFNNGIPAGTFVVMWLQAAVFGNQSHQPLQEISSLP